jgi:ATP-dependent protease HslVU (ClpYQ) peptidase subunit
MTVLGAMVIGDQAWIGADSQVEVDLGGEMRVKQTFQKVFRLDKDPTILWGFAGSITVGFALRDWIQSKSFSSWRDLRSRVGKRVAEILGEANATAEIAGQPPTGLFEVVIAGIIDPRSGSPTSSRTAVLR